MGQGKQREEAACQSKKEKMINAYQTILNYKGDYWEGFLEEKSLKDIFQPLLQAYEDPIVFKSAIRYIVMAYSVESDCIILGTEWHKNKQNIFEKAQVQPIKGLYEELVLLKKEEVLQTINNWLEWQQNDAFKQVQLLKDLRIEMQMASLAEIKNAAGEIAYDQKFKCANYAIELKNKIKDLESELIQNNPKLKDAVRETRKATQNMSTIGPESFSK